MQYKPGITPRKICTTGSLYSLALLVSHRAGGLAGRLAGGLALAAAALFSRRFQISLVDCLYVLQGKHLFLMYIAENRCLYNYITNLNVFQGEFAFFYNLSAVSGEFRRIKPENSA